MAVNWWDKLFIRKPPENKRQPCFIQFEVANVEALERLTTIVAAFQADKSEGNGRSAEEWASAFLPNELNTFWHPDDRERQAWDTYWFSTPLPERHRPEMPTPPWHFGSMLEAVIENGDYDLIGIRTLQNGEGRLEYNPHGDTYGGTGALRALVRAFGHRVIGMDDGTGYETGDPQAPRWTPGMQVQT